MKQIPHILEQEATLIRRGPILRAHKSSCNFHLLLLVTGSTDDGLLEGLLRGKSGLFPARCVQEVRLRNPDALRHHQHAISLAPSPSSNGRVAGRREQRGNGSASSTPTMMRSKTDREIFEEAMRSKAKL